MDSTCRSSCVKLYLCSNPEDSVVERRALRESGFPKLREHCRHTWGLDFSVIDPFESSDRSRWPDENTRQQLINECRESSSGPFLLALVGHQYGAASLPAQVEVSEFQLLLQQSQRGGISTQELERLYQRDENTIPPSYCLRPPHRAPCRPQAGIDKEEWSMMKAKEDELMKIIQMTVSLCVHNNLMTPERGHTYYRSALDADLRFALDERPDHDTIGRCLVYVNKVVNAERETERGRIHSQSEASDLRFAPSDQHFLSELSDNFLPGLIASRWIQVYTTTTECNRRYGYTSARRRGYTESLCQQVCSDLMGLIDSLNPSETWNQTQLGDALTREWAEQEELCDSLSRFYDVIRPEEEEIRAYVKQSDQQCPLVVVGGPCTGKTVLLAHCAQQMRSWLPHSDPVVITYFYNLQQMLSPTHLLSSLCYQIENRYHSDSSSKKGPSIHLATTTDYHGCITDPKDPNSSCSPTPALDSQREPTTSEHVSDFNLNRCTKQSPAPRGLCPGIIKPDIRASELRERLSSLLSRLPSPKQPLLLNLSGLDQIENKLVCLQIIESLPSPLPPGVKLFLTVSSNRTHVLQAIKLHYQGGSERESGCVCVRLGSANRKECVKLLASLLSSSGRRITSGQQALVNQALSSCCLTLYARLLHVHTLLWFSDSDVTSSSLPDGIHASISAFLHHLEMEHGSSVVARAVSFLTLSRTGLAEVELADLLSGDNEVLSEHGQQGQTSSSVSVPQIDVERLLLDLRRFLIRRKSAGSPVLLWVSRHFKLVVAKRYLSTQEARREIHSEMTDYFSGRWACGNAKPLLDNLTCRPNKAEMKMYIVRQPFVFTCSSQNSGRVNLRKIIELPFHLQQSGRWEELERGLLMSLQFHQAMVRAGLLGELVAMLEDSKSQIVFRERRLLAGMLKSSACLLKSVPLQLPVVMETSLLPYLELIPELQGYVREIRRERSERGSGLGVLICPTPSSVPPIQCLKCETKTDSVSVVEAVVTECGIVAEITDDGSAWIWKGPGCDVVKVSLSCEQKELEFTGVKSSGRLVLLSTRCNKCFLWDVTGPEMFVEVKDPLKTQSEPNSSQQTAKKVEGFVACQKQIFMWWRDESFVSVFSVSSDSVTLFQCQSSVTRLVCSSNGLYVFCGLDDGTVSIFDTVFGSLLSSSSNSNHRAVTVIIISEDGREMVCVDRTGNVTLWDVASKTRPPRLVKERFTGGKSNDVLNTDHSDEIDMLLVCQSHQVTLWDASDWELWDQFLAPKGRAFAQAVLSQGGHLFLASFDACALVLVWRVSSGECVLSLEANKQPHTLLKTASDVICLTHDGCLTVWDSEMIDAAGAALKLGRGVKEVVVEETGERFYATDGSETVWRWTLETGFPHANFLHDGPVEKLCLSADNIHLVTLSAGEIYIWKTETSQNILRINGSRATDIMITPNNKFGVSISKQGLSQVWKLANGRVVCSIHLYLSNAKVSPESTFLIGHRQGDLLAASLWSGSISKRFSCVESSDHVVAFQTISEHPDLVVVIAASGAVYTWKVADQTVCRHFQLPYTFQCQPQDIPMSSDGRYALLSTDNNTINLLDLSQVRLCSFKADGPVIKACMDESGCFAAYISLETTCVCELHVRPVLTVVRLADGERVGSVSLSKNPSTLVVCKQQYVYVGFEDGSLGVYSVSDVMFDREELVRCRENITGDVKRCPFERAPVSLLPLATPNVIWP
ncbi:NACHT and WD repeat domain-containing protein 2 [Hippoglossus hippoglossus]|uniref:NACHT and WD repeat domain-containing protein 2 n=1 Tax=Hippoglossus hippoglossus TaxID=8267 RepID=UPI00148E8F9A|nr:NACHT and WD repeat domain-containing protein 2 [Hippoglossus hippoglossus]